MIKRRHGVVCGVKNHVLQLLVDGPDMTYQEIGEVIGVSRQRIQQITKNARIIRGARPYKRRDVAVEVVLNLYNNDMMVNEIARVLRCCYTTINSRLRDAGIVKSNTYSRSRRLLQIRKGR